VQETIRIRQSRSLTCRLENPISILDILQFLENKNKERSCQSIYLTLLSLKALKPQHTKPREHLSEREGTDMRHRARVKPDAGPMPSRRTGCPFSELKRQTLEFWHRSQIGHRSEYSVERLLAFRDYHERVSLLRVVAVCFFTPLPALSVALAIDCIPLVPPSAGWRANYAVWMRLFAVMITSTVGLTLQLKQVVAADTISLTGAFWIAMGSAFASVAMSIAIATWRFPIPFGYVVMVGPYLVVFAILTAFAVGRPVLASSPVLRKQIKSQLMIIATQGLVAVAYPAFSATFNQLSGFHQTIFVFVMPVIKFTTKQIVANTAEHLHEYLGPIVVFSVDVFNVFYVAMCMQAATSIATTVIIVCSDSFHVVLALRDMFRHSNASQVRPNNSDGGPSQSHTNFLRDLPAAFETSFPGSDTRVRTRAPFPLPLSDESWRLLEGLVNVANSRSMPAVQLEAESIGKPAPTSDSQSSRVQLKTQMESPTALSILPALRLVRVVPTRQITQAQAAHIPKGSWKQRQHPPQFTPHPMSEEAVQDALQTLFHSEYVLMAEYIEFMLPMLYATYLTAIFHLPVAAYYPHTRSMTEQKLKATVASILLFSAIEFAAFVALLFILKRKFGFSPLHQLAFVLETQFCSVQGHLFVWSIYILHLTLVHYGTLLMCALYPTAARKIANSSLVLVDVGVDLNAPFK